jgi:hypothetical protein
VSVGVVALFIWDQVVVAPPPPEIEHPAESAKVAMADNAPAAQLDLSKGNAGSTAESLEIAGPAPKEARAGDKLVPLQEEAPAVAAAAPRAMMARRSAKAAGHPFAPEQTRAAMSEEERSARNEELFAGIEKQKKSMGMRILPKSEPADGKDHKGVLAQIEPPSVPIVRGGAAAMLKSSRASGAAAGAEAPSASPASGPGRPAPDAALVFTDASSVASSWILLGLPGKPPVTDFENGRLLIIKPSATKIVSVSTGTDAVIAVYRSLRADEESDPVQDRVTALPATPKNVLIYDASPSR